MQERTKLMARKHVVTALERDLKEVLGLAPHTAKDLALKMKRAQGEGDPKAVDRVLDEANKALDGFGVEAIEMGWHGHYYLSIALLYVNLGDTYQNTVLYDTEEGRFEVGSWGNWVEMHEGLGPEIY